MLMPAKTILSKKLSANNLLNDSKKILNLVGYPITCPENRYQIDEKNFFFVNYQKTKPQLIAIQADPLPYMYKARVFAQKILPSLQNNIDKDRFGIFANQELDKANEKSQTQSLSDKVHSVFFPMNW